MMRTMRAHAKWVFYILAIAFIGWLAYGQVMEILGPGTNVVLRVNGRKVQVPEYQQAVQAALQQLREQDGSGPVTREEQRDVENRVVDELIQNILLQEEYRQLGITVTADEVRAAARASPLPELQRAPDFQTDGRFDIDKYRRFLSTATPEFLRVLEARYREEIPRIKLLQYLTADVYVSDGRLWRVYRDQHDSARVSLVALWANTVPDSLAPVTDEDLERYYRAHRDDFKRSAVAFLSYTALDRRPDPADTAAALARARELRAEAAGGGARFADVARRASADTVSARDGGDLGWFVPDRSGFDAQFLAGLGRLSPGRVSEPVLTEFGYHLIRLDAARGDSVRASHILVPIELRPERLDQVEARADSLDRLASEQTDPSALDSAARTMSLPLARNRVTEGERVTLGRFVIPDAGVWAFEARPGETSPVIEGGVAYYVFRLDSLIPEGTPPLPQVRDAVVEAVRRDKKKSVIAARAQEIAPALRQGPSLGAAAAGVGVVAQRLGPFTRLSPPAVLGNEPLVLGAAFGLRVGQRSGVIAGEHGYYVVALEGRTPADSSAWLAQRDAQREALVQRAREARVQAYVAGLREQAKIVDRRQELARAPADAPVGAPIF